MFKRLPLHPFLFALYPVLSLLGANVREVYLTAALRPAFVSLGLAAVAFGLAWVWLRSALRAGLAASLFLALFFSYGHLYGWLHKLPEVGLALGRHRYLAPLFGLALTAGLFWIWRKARPPQALTGALNLICAALLLFPLYQTASYTIAEAARPAAAAQAGSAARPQPKADSPDVYYIILDSYTRADAMLADFGFDNQPFLSALEQMGFYVARCARSNYSYTMASLVTSLNMDYLQGVYAQPADKPLAERMDWDAIKHSALRAQLEAQGYRTVAFETGYPWTEVTDADVYFQLTGDRSAAQGLTPFESMLLKSTALVLYADAQKKVSLTQANNVNYPFSYFIAQERFVLQQLPGVANIEAPTFAFVHLLIPHIPYVFAPDGSIQTDTGFYDGDNTEPRNPEYQARGYTDEVQFINNQLLNILRQILDSSSTPPVIIIQGDHGLHDAGRLAILNAYYLPGTGKDALYPTITPVNSFRVVLNAYFGGQYPLLPDLSYSKEDYESAVPEGLPACQ
jgi:hypothetical protein